MAHIILAPELERLVREADDDTLREFFSDYHPKQAALFIEDLSVSDIWYILSLLEANLRAGIFSYFEWERQLELLREGREVWIKSLLDDLSSDDRADLFKRLDDKSYHRFMALLPKEDRRDVERLVSYEEGTAGAVMSTDFAYCYVEQSVETLLLKLRKEGPSKETIYYIYVVDSALSLKGLVSLKDLVLSEPEMKIGEIMHEDIISGNVTDDQEDIAGKIEEYDIIALPIVDNSGRLVGIVTHDDVMDILVEEQTEDVERMMAITGDVESRDYLDVPVFTHFRKRVPWVIGLFLVGNLSAFVVGHFEDVLNRVVVLAFFFPLLMGTGGNTGAQSASVVLRSLTLKEVDEKDFLKVLRKEFMVALIIALILFSFIFLRVYLVGNEGADVLHFKTALAIALALGAQVITSTLIGAFLPLAAIKAKLDPAVVAMPAITTIVDITGLLIYFQIAKAVLAI